MILIMKEKEVNIKQDPGLPKLGAGYTVPEGYFESFGDRLKLRMEAKERLQRQPLPKKGLLVYLRPALGLAAGLAIIVTVYLHPFGKQSQVILASVQNTTDLQAEDQADHLSNTYASLVTEGQFLSALKEMDDYDASKISKDGLADYLASNCSDFEILNANK
jgi:hypothetical protein